MSTLALDYLQFELQHSSLSGHVYEAEPDRYDFVWCLNLEFNQIEYADRSWKPRLYHDELRLPARRLADLEHSVHSWDEAIDGNRMEPNGCMYVFEHGDIYEATLTFRKRDGVTFGIKWEGECGVHWVDRFRDDVPFSFVGSVAFDTLSVCGRPSESETELRSRLAQFLTPDDFDLLPILATSENTIYASFVAKS